MGQRGTRVKPGGTTNLKEVCDGDIMMYGLLKLEKWRSEEQIEMTEDPGVDSNYTLQINASMTARIFGYYQDAALALRA